MAVEVKVYTNFLLSWFAVVRSYASGHVSVLLFFQVLVIVIVNMHLLGSTLLGDS